ncbi:Metallo-dependent phosphatase-like protein [Triangularia verruculosa]|uniref:Metallo-dependent phosphatase-like protein n=1 Tax=Triangularia verruculosa TaxID=2587418 RepID=A0AAN7ASB5_9PEZI|nr:Metallo-dependent phosphatase-like protein [Triangularia verruculosa]
MEGHVKTKFFILADTHCYGPDKFKVPDIPVDVAIHCGDLTEGSKLAEFHTALDILREINAPLKLVIAGNHDFTLDTQAFSRKLQSGLGAFKDPEEVIETVYGTPGEARYLIDSHKDDGIVFLDEGTHVFTLENGANLTVYASPFTPSRDMDKGFTYKRRDGHKFNIPDYGVDIVMTHGPPRNILDTDYMHTPAGCSGLYQAVAKVRPRMHCFGHIHEAWGAKLVSWRKYGFPIFNGWVMDGQATVEIDTLSTALPGFKDCELEVQIKAVRLLELREAGYIETSHSKIAGDAHPVEPGRNTLFVNAAVTPYGRKQNQLPWVVEIDLPVSKEACRTEATTKAGTGGNSEGSMEEIPVAVVKMDLDCLPSSAAMNELNKLNDRLARMSIKSAA